jgi:hypothetical protein
LWNQLIDGEEVSLAECATLGRCSPVEFDEQHFFFRVLKQKARDRQPSGHDRIQ